MQIERCALVWAVVLAGSPAAQEAAPLRIEGAVGVFAARFAACQRAVSAATTAATTGEQRAHELLGCLRLGQQEAARDRLDWGGPDRDDADLCWDTIAHHWYLRASRDAASVGSHLPALHAALSRASEAAGPAATFAEAALLPHAWFCLGDLLDACGDAGRGAACTRRAVGLWLDLERQVWQPGRGHFRPHPTHGDIVLPEPPDATVLAPAAAGLLIASADRLTRHLRASSPALLRRPPADTQAAAWLLCGAAQLGDHELLEPAWNALLAADTGNPVSPDAAGRQLDALLFAITGLRLATGAGIDHASIHLRPWLPPGIDHLTLRNVLADGARFELAVAARQGEPRADEQGEAALCSGQVGRRLRVQVRLLTSSDGSGRTILLAGSGVQYVTRLAPGEHLARSVPLTPP